MDRGWGRHGTAVGLYGGADRSMAASDCMAVPMGAWLDGGSHHRHAASSDGAIGGPNPITSIFLCWRLALTKLEIWKMGIVKAVR